MSPNFKSIILPGHGRSVHFQKIEIFCKNLFKIFDRQVFSKQYESYEKAKPIVKLGRKVTGLFGIVFFGFCCEIAGLPFISGSPAFFMTGTTFL
jgi:hypothetical protein